MTASTSDNPAENRYEIHDDDRLAGFSEYRINGRRIAFTHTETLPDFAGRGLARQLVAEALEDVRRRGLDVLPFCPYVRKVIARHPEVYLSLVPEEDRDRFRLPRTRTA
ncbi:GNAT family N-acetyltransferase [Streptomyces sp. NPDC087226]|uniref:GNAT family N-acetyltransferase n=1 Tax=Streptomyces sp. NPDC087226 TaxID=3365771 RepID=UPI003824B6B9